MKRQCKRSFVFRNAQGVTFIEIILYSALVTIILSALIPFTLLIMDNAAKSSTQQEVSSQARYLAERIAYEIRNASGITSISSTSLSLTETNAAVNPTVITLSGSQVTITQGAGAAVRLHSQDTSVTSLAFTNYTSSDSKTKHIGYTFTMGNAGTQTRQEYSQSVSIESSAEIRSN